MTCPQAHQRDAEMKFKELKVGPSTESHSVPMQHLVHKGCVPGCYHSLTIPEFCPKDGHPFYQSSLGAKWSWVGWTMFGICMNVLFLVDLSDSWHILLRLIQPAFRQAWYHLHQGQGTTHASDWQLWRCLGLNSMVLGWSTVLFYPWSWQNSVFQICPLNIFGCQILDILVAFR